MSSELRQGAGTTGGKQSAARRAVYVLALYAQPRGPKRSMQICAAIVVLDPCVIRNVMFWDVRECQRMLENVYIVCKVRPHMQSIPLHI